MRLLTFCVPYGVLYWAEQWVPSGLAAVLFATSPLWVALAAHLMLPAERLRAATAAGVLIGFAGVAVIFSEDLRALGGPRVAGAAALLLLAPLTSAVGVVAVKRWGAGMHPLSVAAVPMALTAAGMGCLAWRRSAASRCASTGLSLAALLYLALFGTALSFTLYFWLLAPAAGDHPVADQLSDPDRRSAGWRRGARRAVHRLRTAGRLGIGGRRRRRGDASADLRAIGPGQILVPQCGVANLAGGRAHPRTRRGFPRGAVVLHLCRTAA